MRRYILELKSIADVGLIGFPNAGKSTFLSSVSRATPKIASYPFTTLAPYVGTVKFKDSYELSIADVPGLVENAHLNYGLGFEFLRHLERTKVLLFVIDCSSSTSSTNTQTQSSISISNDLFVLRNEISRYSQEMSSRPFGVLANKCDTGEKALENVNILYESYKSLAKEQQDKDIEFDIEFQSNCSSSSLNLKAQKQQKSFFQAISAKTGVGISSAIKKVRKLVEFSNTNSTDNTSAY